MIFLNKVYKNNSNMHDYFVQVLNKPKKKRKANEDDDEGTEEEQSEAEDDPEGSDQRPRKRNRPVGY